MDNDSASSGFSIWIDADACPREVRDLAWRNALGRRIRTVFVANSFLWLPDSEYLVFELVPPGADKADDHIVEKAGPLDLAVTGDIPLAARLVERGIMVLSPRGEEMTQANIGERLAMRNLMD
ncbi:MAG: DUF188 domain-containing protein, partial [Planctomycetota bacterium]|nr:DUF188 domain-containing protein [Planctomycetota bacterium]